ncbi:MAG: cupin [Actinomycetota bacterium]
MPTLIPAPTSIPVPGGKVISEYIGRVNTATGSLSVAHMVSPAGWQEPAQVPDFDEYTLVLRGAMRVEHDGGALDVGAGQALITHAGERVRYSTPGADGCEYVAICLPAFSPETVHREGE